MLIEWIVDERERVGYRLLLLSFIQCTEGGCELGTELETLRQCVHRFVES